MTPEDHIQAATDLIGYWSDYSAEGNVARAGYAQVHIELAKWKESHGTSTE